MHQETTNQIWSIVALVGAIGFPTLIVLVLTARYMLGSKNPRLSNASAFILTHIGGSRIERQATLAGDSHRS